MSRTAKIILDAKSAPIDCGVIDYSAGGACLDVFNAAALPRRFELLYAGTRKKCRAVWTAGRRVGVSF
nr:MULTISPECIES: PilZ domain-containing protein [unclassified Bradyrhizobium]